MGNFFPEGKSKKANQDLFTYINIGHFGLNYFTLLYMHFFVSQAMRQKTNKIIKLLTLEKRPKKRMQPILTKNWSQKQKFVVLDLVMKLLTWADNIVNYMKKPLLLRMTDPTLIQNLCHQQNKENFTQINILLSQSFYVNSFIEINHEVFSWKQRMWLKLQRWRLNLETDQKGRLGMR